LLLAGTAAAQQSSPVAYFELTAIRPGMEDQFEATLKRHWAWHAVQGENWSYFVWTIESGENLGRYRVASFGHTWQEVDDSSLAVAGTPGSDADPEPLKASTQASYFLFRSDLSSGDMPTAPASLSTFVQISVRPEALREFENALKGFYASLQESHQPTKLSVRCYELVSGGDWPLFILMEDRPNWAAFEGKGLLESLSRATRHSGKSQQLADALLRSVRSVHTEVLHYHAELSRIVLPGSK
jgi:hypothetical protein